VVLSSLVFLSVSRLGEDLCGSPKPQILFTTVKQPYKHTSFSKKHQNPISHPLTAFAQGARKDEDPKGPKQLILLLSSNTMMAIEGFEYADRVEGRCV